MNSVTIVFGGNGAAVKDLDAQTLAEVVAALYLGNKSLGSITVDIFIQELEARLTSDPQHYLYCHAPNDTSRFTGCGSVQGMADTMVADNKIWYAVPCDPQKCPNEDGDPTTWS